MKLAEARVLLNCEILDGIRLLRLEADDIARDAVAGQFVHVRCSRGSDPLLRRPISLYAIGSPATAESPGRGKPKSGASPTSSTAASPPQLKKGQIDLLFARVGRGTELLAQLAAGDTVSVLGPLGKGFHITPKTRNVLLIGGGIGMAPLSALAAQAVARDLTVTMLCGFKSEDAVLPAWLLPPEVEYVVCTEDGTAGRKGIVTDIVVDFLDWADEAFACGPRPMLSALARTPLLQKVRAQVSLEERMGCGVGACLGCVVRTKHGLQRVCRDGPVFEMKDIVWE